MVLQFMEHQSMHRFLFADRSLLPCDILTGVITTITPTGEFLAAAMGLPVSASTLRDSACTSAEFEIVIAEDRPLSSRSLHMSCRRPRSNWNGAGFFFAHKR